MSAADALMGVFGFKRVESEMKTDRELLELAARAANWHKCKTDSGLVFYTSVSGLLCDPIQENSSSFDLLVYLRLELLITDQGANVCRDGVVLAFEPHVNDHFAATRRAIVRAAAAIGDDLAPFPTAEQIREDWT